MHDSDASRIQSDLLDSLAEAGRTGRYSTGTPKVVAQVLAEIPVFAGLNGRHRRRIADHAEIAEIKAGEAIVREGFMGPAAYVLLTGAARVERAGETVAEIERGAVVGELCLLTGRARTATVTATSDLWLLRIKRDTFLQLLEQEPTIALHLLESLAQRLWDADYGSSADAAGADHRRAVRPKRRTAMLPDPVATVQRYHDAWNEHDDAERLARLVEIWDDDGFYIGPEIPEGLNGPEAFSAFIAQEFEAYPGLAVAAPIMRAVQGDRALYQWTATTDAGESFSGIDFIEFAGDGRIARVTSFLSDQP